ncbi:MAG TPA: hypothetical protein VKT77_12380 [Chthonomonadaceae bacterium]|nr:hypothetical protein [Chthonomonadaceae bacterium]
MNADFAATPWHAASYERFLFERLPELLALRLPLGGCRVEPGGANSYRVTVRLQAEGAAVETVFEDVPMPEPRGVFHFKGRRIVVPPVAAGDDLDTAEIACVGEQLYGAIEARLGEAPRDVAWDESLLRAWIPLSAWIGELFERAGQPLTDTNWLCERAHLRRILLPPNPRMFRPGHYGRVCPIETPEGPNIGRVLALSVGATIRDGRIVVEDGSPAAGYGLVAHMVPFLEHDEPARLLMGVNMLRQWLTPPDPEPALVQTGFEPDDAAFWCGRSFLTAFVSWGVDTFEDGIVVSESAAARLAYPAALEPGDKLSNRHGSKGIVSRILRDAEMPRLEDGTPVELVFDCTGLFSRLNVGLVREAVQGLLARHAGAPAIVPPFAAPKEADLREALRRAGLPADGMTQLFLPPSSAGSADLPPTPSREREGAADLPPTPSREREGAIPDSTSRSADLPPTPSREREGAIPIFPPSRLREGGRGVRSAEPAPDRVKRAAELEPLRYRSTVGYVYWGKLDHRAADKIAATVTTERAQRQGSLEYYALKQCGAVETIREQFNTRAAEREDAATLAERAAAGPVLQAPPPAPQCARLFGRLAAAGIEASLEAAGVAFRLAPPAADGAPGGADGHDSLAGEASSASAGPAGRAAPSPESALALARPVAYAGTARERLQASSEPALVLARPVAHPWLPELSVSAIGACPELPEYRDVVEANASLARVAEAAGALPAATARAAAGLERAVRALFEGLVGPEQLRLEARTLFSGRAVAAPSLDLRHDRAEIPDEIAWTLFGPLVEREAGREEAARRSDRAVAALDAVMERSWVILHRPPVIEPTGMIAFRATRSPERVVRIPPMANALMDADFDGDLLTVFLPITEPGQREAGERLSIAAHLRRDPGLLPLLLPAMGARYGLALLGRAPEGPAEISRTAGTEVRLRDGLVGRESILAAAGRVLAEAGVEAALGCIERLAALGFAAAKRSGLSMPPFAAGAPAFPPPPESASPRLWDAHREDAIARLVADRANEESPAYPFLLAALSGARGTLEAIPRYLAAFGVVENAEGGRTAIRQSLYAGFTAEELGVLAVRSRNGHALAVRELDQVTRTVWQRFRPAGLNVLDRAMRSPCPGIVLAHAAAAGEPDPLESEDARFLVGSW